MLLSEVHAFWAKKSDWLVRLRQGAGARGADGAGDFGAAEAALQCLETAQALHRLFSSVVTTVTAALLSPQQMIRVGGATGGQGGLRHDAAAADRAAGHPGAQAV
jgi:hypothetical protein